VASAARGRENHYRLEAAPLDAANRWLAAVTAGQSRALRALRRAAEAGSNRGE
jgi:hypothetical protein